MPQTQAHDVRIYDEGAEDLMSSDLSLDRVSLVPDPDGPWEPNQRIRILWGQRMRRDVVDGRYRTVICGVNEQDNSHSIISQFVELIGTSQWTPSAVTAYARMFHESVASLGKGEQREPYILKYDLDRLLILAILRPAGRDHFTLNDLARGFRTITQMLHGRSDRLPVASVSFLGAHSNRLLGPDGRQPSFETVLRTMYEAGYRGDVYPTPLLWRFSHVGCFASYPFPEGVARMREGSS